LEGCDSEDHSSRQAQGNSLKDPIFKITRTKWIGGVAPALKPQVQTLVLQKKAHNLFSKKNSFYVLQIYQV
jgi:hypothetical protein